jgi:acyl-coenzyme A synthetase/AMP-(fatty) acid ligase
MRQTRATSARELAPTLGGCLVASIHELPRALEAVEKLPVTASGRRFEF